MVLDTAAPENYNRQLWAQGPEANVEKGPVLCLEPGVRAPLIRGWWVLLGLKWEDNAAVWRLSGCRAAQDTSSVCIGNGLGPACLRTVTVSGECAVSLSLQRSHHLEGTPASLPQSLFAQCLMKDLSQCQPHRAEKSTRGMLLGMKGAQLKLWTKGLIPITLLLLSG